jgi:hypothetical protein
MLMQMMLFFLALLVVGGLTSLMVMLNPDDAHRAHFPYDLTNAFKSRASAVDSGRGVLCVGPNPNAASIPVSGTSTEQARSFFDR